MLIFAPRLMGRTAGGGGGSSFTIPFQASAVSNAPTITTPASVLTNDFGILVDIAYNGTAATPSSVTPTNWTNRHDTSGAVGTARNRLMVSSKVLTTAEASGSITGMNDDNEDKVMLVFRPSRAIVSATFSTFNSQITSSDPSLQTVSALGQPSPLIVVGLCYALSSTAAFSTASPAFDATVATGTADLLVGYKVYNSSPADHSIDMSDLGGNVLASFFVRFT
jgi:hypothetical protein